MTASPTSASRGSTRTTVPWQRRRTGGGAGGSGKTSVNSIDSPMPYQRSVTTYTPAVLTSRVRPVPSGNSTRNWRG